MARNRQRAKERRSRRPSTGPAQRPGVATARPELDHAPFEHEDLDEAPSPLEHASPDVEIAEAQLAVGRPELTGDEESASDADDEFDEAELEEGADGPGGYDGDTDGSGGDGTSGGGEVAVPGAAPPARRRTPGSRLIHFLQGSWRELQRVQWPDRRQVMQATGVVIGFVIVAGLFLGLADTVSSKIVTWILK